MIFFTKNACEQSKFCWSQNAPLLQLQIVVCKLNESVGVVTAILKDTVEFHAINLYQKSNSFKLDIKRHIVLNKLSLSMTTDYTWPVLISPHYSFCNVS